MKNMRLASFRRSFLVAVLTMLAVLTCSSAALAFGTVRFKQTRIEEQDEKWKLDMEVDYGSTPHMGHIPFDFVFELKTYYEYSIQDGDKEPQIRPKPQREQPPRRLSVDIDFSDASGKVWQKTKFSISIRRKDDFEAGEYRLVIRRTSDGAQLGQPVTLIFNGKNQLVDRRTMIMPESGHRRKATDASADAGSDDGAAPASTEPGDKADKQDERSAPTEDKSKVDEEKPAGTVDKRPGGHGCGCQLPGTPAPLELVALGCMAAGLVALRTRRRSR